MNKPIMKEASAVVRKDWLNILDTYSQIF